MKKLIFFLSFFLFTLSYIAQEETTTYYLIRHAEKDRTNTGDSNPKLNKKGLERALKWREVFSNISFDAVYSTKYNRTIETAKPTAKVRNLEILFYDPKKMYNPKFREETRGLTVLIVGHSNTTPFFVNRILREEKYDQIEDNNNANLYIVTVTNEAKNALLLKID